MVRRDRLLIALLLTALLLGACRPVQRLPEQESAPPSAAAAEPAAAPTTEPPKLPTRILFIGDSLSWFLGNYFPKLAASSTPPIVVNNNLIWIGGAPLSQHWADASTLEEIRTGKWDAVVLQEDVAELWANVDQFPIYAGKFKEEIAKTGAATFLYMTMPPGTLTVPTTEQIAAVYDKTGADIGAAVIPVGVAWQRALQERPDLVLLGTDQTHPSPYGVYLTLCVFYASLFSRSPEGLAYRFADAPRFSSGDYIWDMPEGWQLTDEEAAFFQRIAWETVTDQQAD